MEVLDEQWIDTYRGISRYPNLIDSKLRSKNAEDEKQAFLNNNFSANPNLKPTVDIDKLQQREDDLRSLADDIGSSNTAEVVKLAYIPRLGELALNLQMLRSSALGDTDGFIEANRKIYGEPNYETFSAVASYFVTFAEEQLDRAKRPEIRLAANELIQSLTLPNAVPFDPISANQFHELKALFGSIYEEALEGIQLPSEISGQVAFKVAEKVLNNLGYDYSVVPQNGRMSTMSVNHAKKQVKIPEHEVYTAERFKGLMGHEVNIHIAERINGETQPIQMLYSGLHRYLKAGEGKGVLTEQSAYDSYEDFLSTKRFFDLARRYLSIGLARGLDGGVKRDFKSVFNVINKIDFLWESKHNGGDTTDALRTSFDKTWELLAMRTLKGSSGSGAAAYKDMVYLLGVPEQANLVLSNPEAINYLNFGKYDLTKPNHRFILGEIGTVPSAVLAKATNK